MSLSRRSRRCASVLSPEDRSGINKTRCSRAGCRFEVWDARECLVVIHRLTPGDEPQLQELCSRFKDRVPSNEEAASLLAHKDIHVWVAEVDAELAGFAYAYVLSRIDGDTSVFLYELGVDERFRRQGLGRALVERARTLAERVGALKMWVDTDYDNEAAKHTYASAGGEPFAEPTLVYGWRFR
jgi:GNAT superfamily N-acetyltransferase